MTVNDLKKLDRQLQQIQNPLGSGFPSVRKVADDWSAKTGLSVHKIALHYIAWKWKK